MFTVDFWGVIFGRKPGVRVSCFSCKINTEKQKLQVIAGFHLKDIS